VMRWSIMPASLPAPGTGGYGGRGRWASARGCGREQKSRFSPRLDATSLALRATHTSDCPRDHPRPVEPGPSLPRWGCITQPGGIHPRIFGAPHTHATVTGNPAR
jgi:hypothetical protein